MGRFIRNNRGKTSTLLLQVSPTPGRGSDVSDTHPSEVSQFHRISANPEVEISDRRIGDTGRRRRPGRVATQDRDWVWGWRKVQFTILIVFGGSQWEVPLCKSTKFVLLEWWKGFFPLRGIPVRAGQQSTRSSNDRSKDGEVPWGRGRT